MVDQYLSLNLIRLGLERKESKSNTKTSVIKISDPKLEKCPSLTHGVDWSKPTSVIRKPLDLRGWRMAHHFFSQVQWSPNQTCWPILALIPTIWESIRGINWKIIYVRIHKIDNSRNLQSWFIPQNPFSNAYHLGYFGMGDQQSFLPQLQLRSHPLGWWLSTKKPVV